MMFYIINDGGRDEWYRLHYTKTHHCLGASGDYHSLLKTIKRLVTKYKKEERLTKVIERVSGKMSDSTLEKYKKDYKDYKDLDHEVERTIEEALEKVKCSSPLMKAIRRCKNNKKVSVGYKDHSTEVEGELKTTPKGGGGLKRPVLLKRKVII